MSMLRQDISRFYKMSGDDRRITFVSFITACFHPRLAPVVILRASQFCYRHKLKGLAKILAMMNIILFGIEVSPRVEIGAGLFLPHTVGTIIGAARIGDNVTIMQGVTLGAKEPDMAFTIEKRPVIGDGVTIGAGAKVIGGITVGNDAVIGANAVVVHDIPANVTAVGIPAKVLLRQGRELHNEVDVG